MTIYEKYGGYDTIYNAIFDLYEQMCDHPEIAQHFIGVNLERLITLQTQFVSKALGGPVEYKGRPIGRAHAPLHITDFQYDEISKCFTRIFTKHGFENEDLLVIKNLLFDLRKEIVTSKTNILDIIFKPIYKFISYFEDIIRKRGSLDES